MASTGEVISVDLQPATLLSVKRENGIETRVYIAPCSEPRIPEPLAVQKPLSYRDQNTQLFHCTYCGNGIRTAGAFKVHMLACERRFEQMKKNGVLMPSMQCSICQGTFPTVAALRSHRLLHNRTKQKCESCHLEYETEVEYRSHLTSYLKTPKSKQDSPENDAFTVSKAFDCLFCRKAFVAHFKRGHVTRRYACDKCVQRLRNQEVERARAVPPKRKAELSCHRCGRMYKLEGFLNRHLKFCQGEMAKKKE
ncbi:zinc finger protein 99 [Drosophila biarmipes]|uniref:zinc finger protein 99 n=1 Tax=Drosophila biarmipes TaxID=125945 RepID=UPI0007E7EDE0|nr:zinc finger protein 99 [Drosophila biarmipes]